MSNAAAAPAPAAGPTVTVYVDVDGFTGYKEATTCTAAMTDSRLLEALAESRVFKARFHGVDLSLCRVYDMGQDEPAPNTTAGGTLLSGKRTALPSMPEAGSGFDVYIRIDTTTARLTAAAAGAFSPPSPPPGHVVLRGSVLSRVSASLCSTPLLQALEVLPRLGQVRTPLLPAVVLRASYLFVPSCSSLDRSILVAPYSTLFCRPFPCL
jgi:hypothetical protein